MQSSGKVNYLHICATSLFKLMLFLISIRYAKTN